MIVRAMRSPYCLRRALVELKILASLLVRKTISTVESHLFYLIGNDLSVLVRGRKRYLTEGCQAGRTHPAAMRHPSQEGMEDASSLVGTVLIRIVPR